VARKMVVPLWVILVIGIALIVAPFAISMPGKADAGQSMLNGFHSIMEPAHVKKAEQYYDETFMPLGPLATGAVTAAGEIPKLIAGLATALHTTAPDVERLLETTYPAMTKLLLSFPKLVPVFAKVPAGLAFYKPFVDTMQANVANYAKVDSLPSFRLFTWFFVVPGALLVLLAGYGLLIGLMARRRPETAAASSQGLGRALA